MRCSNCGVEVGKEFVFAIKNNTCPACGKCIMKSDQMGAYLSLCELLKSLMQEAMVEKVATLIMANFELKQTFKIPQSNITIDPGGMGQGGAGCYVDKVSEQLMPLGVTPPVPSSSEPMVVQEEPVIAEGIKLEVIDKKKSQALIQQLRDEALSGALGDRYGVEVGEEDEVLLAEDPRANAALIVREQKRANAQRLVADGIGASGKNGFRRSST